MKTDEKNPIFDIRDTLEKYACIYRNTTLKLFQYCQETDIYERLDEYLRPVKNITDFKTSGQKYSNVYKDDWKFLTDFLTSREGGTIEVRCINKDGNASLLTVRGFIAQDKNTGYHYFIGSSRDITREKLQEEFLEERAQKDPLTGVYNRFFGKELIDEYLASRNPYAGCGMMVLDVDYFKNVNDLMYKITIRYTDVTEKDVVAYNGRQFQINYITNPLEDSYYLELMCTESKDHAVKEADHA